MALAGGDAEDEAAPTLYTTMENRAAHRAIRASWVSPPKSTILLMVEATELLMWVMMSTPRKLNTAADQDGCPDVDAPGGDAGGDGVGGIRPSVDENDAQRQQDCDQHGRAGKDLLYK